MHRNYSALTGWIPEHIFIKDANFDAEKQWKRMMNGQRNGKYRPGVQWPILRNCCSNIPNLRSVRYRIGYDRNRSHAGRGG